MKEPNFRCISYADGTYVEVPSWWADRVEDEETRQAISHLIMEDGKQSRIFAEGVAEVTDDHRRTYRGYLIPMKAWDRIFKSQTQAIRR